MTGRVSEIKIGKHKKTRVDLSGVTDCLAITEFLCRQSNRKRRICSAIFHVIFFFHLTYFRADRNS